MFEKMCDHSNGWRPEDGVPDLAMMSDITADGINVNLRTRYQRDQIYTFSGSILIAVNPYRQLDIYNKAWISRYRQQKLDQTDPHIFALTEAMYMNLVMQHPTAAKSDEHASTADTLTNGVKNQACVISGESGAGKTETTKFILSYLCAVTPNKSVWMEHQILEANTILEAFGNAKTVRNDNSSRFGKFIQICFDTRHQINGCIIQDYLLEQSRITYQSIGERNYHVFYQLLAAGQMNEELRKRFHLMPVNFYDYLNKTQCYTIDGVNDCAMFDSLRTAMSVLNLSQESCDGLFGALSAVLWLGNLQFKCDETTTTTTTTNILTNSATDCPTDTTVTGLEQCQLTETDEKIVLVISELLGVNEFRLKAILLKRQISVRGSVTEIPFKLNEARDNRNGMAKALYSRLFTWVVNFINASTNPGTDNACFLGVLDIFGFENFETNSFEQLCINYANEKLHKFFNQHMFAMEQELYKREGVEFCDINFTDNTPCLELLERPPNCILRLLSEECRMPKGNDSTFLDKLHTEFTALNPNPFYIRGQDRRNWSSEFSVRHFAGSVTYKVNGFLKKNRDAQQSQLLDIMETSSNPLLNDIAQCESRGDTAADHFSSASRDGCTPLMQTRHVSIDLQGSSYMSMRDQNHSENSRSRLQSQQSFCAPSSVTSMVNRMDLRRESSFNSDSNRPAASYPNSSTKSRPTVADSFRHQLASLVDLLSRVNPWYVRCIKPNLEKSASGYDDRQVLMQLHYLGMTDLIRIRREGYPVHLTKHQFVCRYRCLMLKHLRLDSSKQLMSLDEATLHSCCIRMINYFKLSSNDWKIGKTMVLLRSIVHQPLEEKRNRLFVEAACKIQSAWRGNVQRKKYLKLIHAVRVIQKAFRAYRDRLLYMRKKRAVLTIQAYCRGMFAREIASAMREIKRAAEEKTRKALEEQHLRDKQISIEQLAMDMNNNNNNNDNNGIVTRDQNHETQIIVSEVLDDREHVPTNQPGQNSLRSPANDYSPSSNVSPMISSSASWIGQELSEIEQRLTNGSDKEEVEELIRILERHGIRLDSQEHSEERVRAEFERLYERLGSHLSQTTCDTQSMTTQMHEEDRSSFACTVSTNGDGDTRSCSGQSQDSTTVTDDQITENNCQSSQDHAQAQIQNDTAEHNQNATIQNGGTYYRNSVGSIESIVSSTSAGNCANHSATNQDKEELRNQEPTSCMEAVETQAINHPALEIPAPSVTAPASDAILVGGSKMVTNGRPLTRIEEEPNSIASSPAKTPCKTRPHSLFPLREADENASALDARQDQNLDIKRRRLERRILQVQQNHIQQEISPTTAGVPTSEALGISVDRTKESQTNVSEQASSEDNADIDAIYGAQKLNILEYAERTFNTHPRDPSSAGGTMIRTLTRRRRSVDANAGENLTKAEMLSYNASFTIPTSHLRMHDPHCAQISCSIFKNLCKYMTGESAKNDNEVRIIQSIIRNGIEKLELRDEIYVQIIRQLTNNQNNDYCLRLWILLGLVSASFSPSRNFSKHMFEYLRTKPRKDPSITCHAQFCLDNLQAPRLGARKLPPSPLEIQACKNLSNLTCKIHLLDGRCETLSVHPCDTVVDTLTKLAHKINLQSIEGWALYESYTSGGSKYPHPTYEQAGDFERTIKSTHFMADLIASWQDGITKSSSLSLKVAQRRLNEGNFSLTFKKKIFRGPKIRNDPVEISLLYAQAVHNVVRKDCFFVDENLALSLAGLQAQVTLGNATNSLKQQTAPDKKGSTAKSTKIGKTIVKTPVQMYEVENYICLRLRNQASRPKKEWCNLIHQAHKQFHNVNEVFCKMRYLSMVIYHCPLYGTATFEVTYKGYQELDQNLMLGVNAEGLVLIRSIDKALINAYRYSDVCPERGVTVYIDEKIIQFVIRDRVSCELKCLTFASAENEEIASLMVSYSPTLRLHLRGPPEMTGHILETNTEFGAAKRKTKLKMTLEDRMRTHQEVQNARRSIIKSGKLRKLGAEEQNPGLLRHTLRRLSSNRAKNDKLANRFDNIYGTLGDKSSIRTRADFPQASSDYNIYGSNNSASTNHKSEPDHPLNEVSGATAATSVDELTRTYPHRYWAYTRYSLKSSLLTIYDPELEEAALTNFNGILTYSGLLNLPLVSPGGGVTVSGAGYEVASGTTALDNSSIDSGIASQQNLSQNANCGKVSNGSPSSMSSSDIYDVCPKKMDERELIRLAQGILDKCLKKDADILKNEFFLQLIKQTTDHPDPNSEINKRHWQLLALACSVTYPSDSKILAYLYAHLRRCSLDQVSDEGQYSQFALRSLQGTLDTKGRKYAPSEMEILSTINCRRVYARVYFLDGQFQAVEFDPCATIAEVVDQIKQKIGLKPDCMGYALFQPLDDDCEQVLRPDEKVGDAISAWEAWHRQRQTRESRQDNQAASNGNQSAVASIGTRANSITKASIASLNANPKTKTHKFVFKKYLFSENLSDLNDPVERELLYYQTVASIKEDKFPVLEHEATILCAIKAQIEIGDYTKLTSLPREHVRMIYKQVVMSLMPPHAFNNIQVQNIAQQHQSFKDLDKNDTKKCFFNLIQSLGRANFSDRPGCILLHRARVYDAKQTFATAWPSNIWIVVNNSGLHVLVSGSRRVLASCEYRQIVDYNANNNNLMIIVLTGSPSPIKYTFYTKQAEQITQQMKDYIVINTSNGTKRKKSVGFNLR